MKRLLLLGTGFAAGYVLGAKAGRERYDEIVRLVESFPDRAPRSFGDLTETASHRAQVATEAARGTAHEVIDVATQKAERAADKADRKVDEVADLADDVRKQTEERLKPGT